jgi:hypothetical protein
LRRRAGASSRTWSSRRTTIRAEPTYARKRFIVRNIDPKYEAKVENIGNEIRIMRRLYHHHLVEFRGSYGFKGCIGSYPSPTGRRESRENFCRVEKAKTADDV